MVVVDAGDAAARWCSTLVGAPVRLVHGAAGAARPVDPDLARPTDAVVFADGFPVHLTVEESLADLNARITDPDHRVTMHRFRPNIVLAGAEPWAEDGWTAVRIGSVPFRVVKPCPRCTVTLVDQRTADRGKEPLRTLATFRRQPDGGVAFGQNLIPDVPPAGATVRVGDEVTVTGRR